MRFFNKSIVTAVLFLAISGVAYSQEQIPEVTLDFSERCNNFLRYYCISGRHEQEVNRILLSLKKRGNNITIKLIKKIARTTPSKLDTPQAQN